MSDTPDTPAQPDPDPTPVDPERPAQPEQDPEAKANDNGPPAWADQRREQTYADA